MISVNFWVQNGLILVAFMSLTMTIKSDFSLFSETDFSDTEANRSRCSYLFSDTK